MSNSSLPCSIRGSGYSGGGSCSGSVSRNEYLLLWVTAASGILIFIVIVVFACKYCSKMRKGEYDYEKEATYLGRVAETRHNNRFSFKSRDFPRGVRSAINAQLQQSNGNGGGSSNSTTKADAGAKSSIPYVTVTDYDADGKQPNSCEAKVSTSNDVITEPTDLRSQDKADCSTKCETVGSSVETIGKT